MLDNAEFSPQEDWNHPKVLHVFFCHDVALELLEYDLTSNGIVRNSLVEFNMDVMVDLDTVSLSEFETDSRG